MALYSWTELKDYLEERTGLPIGGDLFNQAITVSNIPAEFIRFEVLEFSKEEKELLGDDNAFSIRFVDVRQAPSVDFSFHLGAETEQIQDTQSEKTVPPTGYYPEDIVDNFIVRARIQGFAEATAWLSYNQNLEALPANARSYCINTAVRKLEEIDKSRGITTNAEVLSKH